MRLPWTTRLDGYRGDWGNGVGGGAQRNEGGGGGAQNKVSSDKRKQHVPLLGPIPGAPPLILGGELIIDSPTPLQWQTLEESVLLHRQYLKEQLTMNETKDTKVDAFDAPMTTGVDAAPLVAVIDDVTGKGYVATECS